MIPKSGGEYSILLEAFGPIPAYLFAWTATVILKPSSLALLSITFARYALTPAYGKSSDFFINFIFFINNVFFSIKFVCISMIFAILIFFCWSAIPFDLIKARCYYIVRFRITFRGKNVD